MYQVLAMYTVQCALHIGVLSVDKLISILNSLHFLFDVNLWLPICLIFLCLLGKKIAGRVNSIFLILKANELDRFKFEEALKYYLSSVMQIKSNVFSIFFSVIK